MSAWWAGATARQFWHIFSDIGFDLALDLSARTSVTVVADPSESPARIAGLWSVRGAEAQERKGDYNDRER